VLEMPISGFEQRNRHLYGCRSQRPSSEQGYTSKMPGTPSACEVEGKDSCRSTSSSGKSGSATTLSFCLCSGSGCKPAHSNVRVTRTRFPQEKNVINQVQHQKLKRVLHNPKPSLHLVPEGDIGHQHWTRMIGLVFLFPHARPEDHKL
jgi:hypothetical protein